MKGLIYRFKQNELLIQILKFGIVGGIATIIDMFFLFIFKELCGISLVISNTLSFSIAVIYNYIASVKWVFKVKKQNRKRDFILFIVFSIIGLIINDALISILSKRLNIYYLLSKVFATIVTMIFNFITRKLFLEEHKSKKQEVKKINIREIIDSSYFVNQLRKSMPLIIICLILSIVCTMITYPGIYYSDSYGRVSRSTEILNGIKALLKNGIFIPQSSWWLTPIPSIMMAITRLFVDNIAFYTFLQAFFFFLLTCLLIKKCQVKYRSFLYIIFLLNPFIFGVSVYYEAGIGCLSGIILIILLLTSSMKIQRKFDKIIEILLLVFASFITFGYRANAFTIIPVLIGYILLTKKHKCKALLISSITIGFLLTALVPKLLNISISSSKSAGFVWESLEMIKQMPQSKKTQYLDYFDDILGEGVTASAINSSDKYSVNGFVWDNNIISNIGDKKNDSYILKKYLNLLFKESKYFIDVKLNFIKLNLGIGRPLSIAEYDYNRWDQMDNHQFNDAPIRHKFINSYIKFNDIFYLFTRVPIIAFAISVVLVLLTFINRNNNRQLYLFIFLIALFYYGAFLITTQSFEIRYFYPSSYLMMVIDAGMIIDLICFYTNKIKRSDKKYENIPNR